MAKTFFSLTGELQPICKHMFVGEAELLTYDGLVPIAEGVKQCTYFSSVADVPAWVNRGANSYPINFPADCQNCPVYCADPIQKRILEEKRKLT